MLDVDFADLLDYFADDPATSSIILYMESIGDVRKFLSAARGVARTNEVIVVKSGRHEEGAKAAASPTGALAGTDAVFDAAFRRAGILRVSTIPDLFNMSEILATQPPPRGPALAILTNAGGPGVMAVDALITEGGQLARISPETLSALNAALPPFWSHANPIDLLGDATAERYRRALEVCAKDSGIQGLLVPGQRRRRRSIGMSFAIRSRRSQRLSPTTRERLCYVPFWYRWTARRSANTPCPSPWTWPARPRSPCISFRCSCRPDRSPQRRRC
jgi:acyl-CoA synthetase (NDP forming)